MKAIKTDAVISGIRSKADRSLGLTIATPEMTSEERSLFMDLQGINIKMSIEPTDIEAKENHEIKEKLDGKTPSQRLYNVIFRYYKQINSKEDWDIFYKKNMERIIETYKEKLSEQY